jgi:hypothetical protein
MAVAEYLDALSQAHRQMVDHGRLGPESFLVSSDGQLRLTACAAIANGLGVDADLAAASDLLASLVNASETRLPRDLAAVVEKARRGQYPSARSMAEDLRCFVERRPVSARPARLPHRLALFARRRPEVAVALLLVVVAVLATTVYSFAMADAARRSRNAARSRLHQMQQLTYSLESDLYQSVSQLPNSAAARANMIRWTSDSLDSLAAQADSDPELRPQLAAAYRKLAAVEQANHDAAASLQSAAKADTLLRASAKP